MRITITKQYIFFILFLYFFLLKDWLEHTVPIFRFVDELIALLAIPIFFYNLFVKCRKKNGSIWLFVTITVICGGIGNIIYNYQPIVQAALPDLLLYLKFWFCLYAGRLFLLGFEIQKYGKKIVKHIAFVTCVYTVLIIIDNIYPIFKSDTRYGLKATQLFYSHAFVFAACCVLLLTILLLVKPAIKNAIFYKYSIWLSILTVTTLRSRALGCIMVFWLIIYYIYIRKKTFSIWMFLLFIPAMIAIGWNQIYYYFFSDIQFNSARYQLFVKSFQVAMDSFPFGAGFATFGSYFSSIYYSPLYYRYGISMVHGLQEGNAWFVNDSFWPMILGQFGFIGFASMIIVVYLLYKEIQMCRKINLFSYSSCLFIFFYLMIESTSSSAFVHPLSIPFALIIGHVFAENKRLAFANFNRKTIKKI